MNHIIYIYIYIQDDESFQGRFNSLIELNQANRGDLVRNPTSEKLIAFFEKLKDDPTAIWYFLTIHDTVLYPFISYLRWKSDKEREKATTTTITTTATISDNKKRAPLQATTTTTSASATAAGALVPLQASKRPRTSNTTTTTTSTASGGNATTTATTNNGLSSSSGRLSLADEVSSILAQHRSQQPSYAELVDEMDSRAVEQEVEAILARQRQQRLI
jgi:hypothetical protein